MDIKFSGSDAGGFQFDPNAAPKPKRERKPRKSIGSKGGRIAVNTLVTLLVGAVFFYVQMPAINLHAEEFYGFVLLLCVTYCICDSLPFMTGSATHHSATMHSYMPKGNIRKTGIKYIL